MNSLDNPNSNNHSPQQYGIVKRVGLLMLCGLLCFAIYLAWEFATMEYVVPNVIYSHPTEDSHNRIFHGQISVNIRLDALGRISVRENQRGEHDVSLEVFSRQGNDYSSSIYMVQLRFHKDCPLEILDKVREILNKNKTLFTQSQYDNE